MRVDVFPDDFPFGCHLENPAKHPFGNQRVAIGKPARSGNIWAEKVVERVIVVFPNDPIRLWFHFNHSGKRQRYIFAMRAIVENENVSVIKHARIVLLSEYVIA